MTRKDFEIMAPVGSFESLMAAINAGANSVYFGLAKLNMRSRSSVNFTTEDLAEIANRCKNNNVKSYLTINVVTYDNEFVQVKELVDAAKQFEVSAIIASDMAVIQYANQVGVPVHMSTQVNISNTQALKFFSQFADVMVLARELSMDQVMTIHRHIIDQNITGPQGELVKIEMFCHGALCMSISGKCYLSLHEYNHSANRGACLQTCRRGYTVADKETGREFDIDNEYIMSPKDLCTIHFVNKLMDSGVRVFKIEGRARPAEYVKTTVECYNDAINSVLENTYTDEKIQKWQKKLGTVFNRGFWDGYYLGQKLGEWSHVYGSKATEKKAYIGKVRNYFSKLNVAELLCEAGELKVGDKVIINGPTTGVVETEVKELRYDLQPVEGVVQKQVFSMPVPTMVRRSDKLYKIISIDEK
ncbi:U32 family peptidase [Bacteroidales bacterium]|nr:U32 family peptidase [Bacteroidales bacterium]